MVRKSLEMCWTYVSCFLVYDYDTTNDIFDWSVTLVDRLWEAFCSYLIEIIVMKIYFYTHCIFITVITLDNGTNELSGVFHVRLED